MDKFGDVNFCAITKCSLVGLNFCKKPGLLQETKLEFIIDNDYEGIFSFTIELDLY